MMVREEGCSMLKMEGHRVRMTPENVHQMLQEGLTFKEIASRCWPDPQERVQILS